MVHTAFLQVAVFLLIVFILVKPLGIYMKRVFNREDIWLDWLIGPLERFIYRCCSVNTGEEMDWRGYVVAMLWFNFIGLILIYLLQRMQAYLPFNPQGYGAVNADLAFNTASSFTTNTGWQAYSGERLFSYSNQLLVVTVQNILSAATGLALGIAFIRGIARNETALLGNFWVDLVRGVLYVLLPFAFIIAVVIIPSGVMQNFNSYQRVEHVQRVSVAQVLPMGPVASVVASRQIGGNGAGFFNVNAAHPFENPTPLINFILVLTAVILPASLFYTYGDMIADRRQGWMLLVVMGLIFAAAVVAIMYAESIGNDKFHQLGLHNARNLEGKETRFGVFDSSLWATVTTATSNGSVNSMHDSYTPISIGIMLTLMHLGEIIFGGVGSGVYGMVLVVLISVFLAGLMVGRTPEYLGKKIEPYDMKLICLVTMVLPLISLLFSAISCVSVEGVKSLGNPGAHGFSEILYAFTSMRNNNGSALAGLNSNTWFYNVIGGICMLIGRYWAAIPALAIAGSFAQKKKIPISNGTLRTNSALFACYLCMVIFVLGVLSFIPTLALGPIVDSLHAWGAEWR